MRHGRRDSTHGDIRDRWRQIVGVENVRDTGDLGGGFGDLVIGYKGVTFILEVKASPKARMRPGQYRAISSWRGGPWMRVHDFRDSYSKIRGYLMRMRYCRDNAQGGSD